MRRQPPLAGGGGARVAVDGDAVGLCRDGQRLTGFGGFPLQVLQLANHPVPARWPCPSVHEQTVTLLSIFEDEHCC